MVESTSHAAKTRGVRALIHRRPLVSYFVLAYVLSWSWWIPMAIQRADVRPGGPSHLPGLFGPMIAALIITGAIGGRSGLRELFARMGRWRVAPRWYVEAFSPFLFFAVAAFAMAAAGEGWPEWSGFGRFDGAPLVGPAGIFLLLLVVNSLGEETGWRGFALPHLQRSRSPLAAAMILGVGAQVLRFRAQDGAWTVVAMNAGGASGIDVTVDMGATFPALPWIAMGLFGGGFIALVLGTLLIVIPIRRAGRVS